jgi:hypothetical protein
LQTFTAGTGIQEVEGLARRARGKRRVNVILHCSFEELTAMAAGAERVLGLVTHGGGGVAAPPEELADLEAFAPQLVGDISINSLGEQRSYERAVVLLIREARERMHESILQQHVAAEEAVSAYFDFGHLITVHRRLVALGHEMAAMIEVMTGELPDAPAADRIHFPD